MLKVTKVNNTITNLTTIYYMVYWTTMYILPDKEFFVVFSL